MGQEKSEYVVIVCVTVKKEASWEIEILRYIWNVKDTLQFQKEDNKIDGEKHLVFRFWEGALMLMHKPLFTFSS